MNFASFCALVAVTATLVVVPAARAQGPDLNALHSALRLTPDQEGAWRSFASASQPTAEDQARERAAQQMMPTLHAPQRVDLSISAMEDDLAILKARGAALKRFYAVLTPNQQQVFDRQTTPRAPQPQYDQEDPYGPQ